MTRIAYFDCLSGISGDMTLGALVDLGAELGAIESAVRSMGLPELSFSAATVKKCGFRAIKVDISHPAEHVHRHLHHITEMIDRADEIAAEAKSLAKHIFLQVAQAEAKVHGTTVEKVHFHEVGAIDSIADIVGTAVAIHGLEIESVVASPVPTGTGSIAIAHGRVSIPAPATAEILCGIPIAASDVQAELTTPTGAAILKVLASDYGPLPAMSIEAIGYGAGSRDLDGQANVLRVLIGEAAEQAPPVGRVDSDRVVVLESNLDDCTPQQLADCAERLLHAGALDVFQTPCTMKKGRVGVVLSVIAAITDIADLERVVFENTSSIGIRRYQVDRHKLPRRSVVVETTFGPVRGKLVQLPGGGERFSVEDDDARQLARSSHVSASEVRHAALQAWSSAR